MKIQDFYTIKLHFFLKIENIFFFSTTLMFLPHLSSNNCSLNEHNKLL